MDDGWFWSLPCLFLWLTKTLSIIILAVNGELPDTLNNFWAMYFSSLLKKMSRMEDAVEKGKTSRAKTFLAEMKRSLSQVNFDHIVLALQSYKKNDNLDVLLSEIAVLTEDANTHSLLRGMSSALQHCRLATCYLHNDLCRKQFKSSLRKGNIV